jgi:hypothetical protein
MRSSLVTAAGALAVVLAASVARADETPDAVRAAALFTEGRQLMAADDYAAACPKLAESQALAPAADTALDLGICYQKASQAAFKAAHELARSSEPGSGVVPAPALALTPEAPRQGQTQRVVGLVIGGVGLAGIVTGVITAVMAKSATDNLAALCPNNLCAPARLSQLSSARNLASASDISLIAGGVALGAGAIVFFTAPTSKTVVGMGPATQGAGLSVAGRF